MIPVSGPEREIYHDRIIRRAAEMGIVLVPEWSGALETATPMADGRCPVCGELVEVGDRMDSGDWGIEDVAVCPICDIVWVIAVEEI